MRIFDRAWKGTVIVLAGCALFWAFRRLEHNAGAVLAAPNPVVSSTAAAVETGTHWAGVNDFANVASLGYQFAVVTLGTRRESWRRTFDAAESNGIQLIAGLYPAPYSLTPAGWAITQDGVDFLKYAASRSSVIKAVFVYNEPYWVDPFTGKTNICGATTAAQLRSLRSAIRAIWADAKIFHDIGQPGAWAPGGWLRAEQACIADKYSDATGIADFVGIWSYPFDLAGYHRASALATLEREIAYVTNKMEAQPIVDMQAFRCDNCGEATRWPTYFELKDWNAAVRSLGPNAVSWYPWRQDAYDDYLANHPDMWSATTAAAAAAATAPSSDAPAAISSSLNSAVLIRQR